MAMYGYTHRVTWKHADKEFTIYGDFDTVRELAHLLTGCKDVTLILWGVVQKARQL